MGPYFFVYALKLNQEATFAPPGLTKFQNQINEFYIYKLTYKSEINDSKNRYIWATFVGLVEGYDSSNRSNLYNVWFKSIVVDGVFLD